MVLVFLKNLIFPQSQPRWTPGSPIQPKPIDLENGLALSPHLKSEAFAADHELQSACSSVSGDTVVEAHPPPSLHRFAIDPRTIADATIGLSDGLTVPFALTAGLSALGDTKVVIFGGLAEICAGAISMGIGGYLAAKGEVDAYNTTVASTRRLVQTSPSAAAVLAVTTISPYLPSFSTSDDSFSENLQAHLTKNPDLLMSFLLRFHHSLQSSSSSRSPYTSALTIALGYFLGGFLPLIPYFFASSIGVAFWWSVAVMTAALFAFGAGKTGILGEEDGEDAPEMDEVEKIEGMEEEWKPAPGGRYSLARRSNFRMKCIRGGVQMVILGGAAAVTSVTLVNLLG